MPEAQKVPTAAEYGVIACGGCGRILRLAGRPEGAPCPRCLAPVHRRKHNSVARCWAFLIAAFVLYIPANLLPIMRTQQLGQIAQDDTILSGVSELWRRDAPELAIIVFVASIVVPLLKIGLLALLLITVQRRSAWALRGRSRIYRFLEFIGHWSMLDVFVVALMTALVQFQAFGVVTPRPGAVAFGAVVVLTMLASHRFDPRLIWDAADDEDEPAAPSPTAEPAAP